MNTAEISVQLHLSARNLLHHANTHAAATCMWDVPMLQCMPDLPLQGQWHEQNDSPQQIIC